LIINALNLIDGIDGLAGVISIVIFSSFGTLFLFLERYFLSSICIVLIGSIIAFLRFNVSNEKKIFMGDTGSMLLGFIISILTLRIIALPNERLTELNFPLQNIPFLIFSFISIPILDLLRVFIIRIFAGKSPFEADRNHFHHLIIDLFKWSHFKTSLFIGFINLLIILIFGIAIMYLGQASLFSLVVVIFLSYYYILNIISSNLHNKQKNQ
jgi:UDP-N-acetylmuramyl pentapeptide phosphotransferase/UDP-N-acetylglucosamine-1-phosphate transferase